MASFQTRHELRRRTLSVLRMVALGLTCVPAALACFMIPNPVLTVDLGPVDFTALVILLALSFALGLGARIVLSDRVLDRLADDDMPSIKKSTHGWRHEGPLDPGLADHYLRQFFTSPHAPSAAETMAVLVKPESAISRVSERHQLGDDRSERTVTRTITGSDQLRVVPVIYFDKGRVLGRLSIEVEGKSSRSLSFGESKGLILSMIRTAYDNLGLGDSDLGRKVLSRIETAALSRQVSSTEQISDLAAEIDGLADAGPADLNDVGVLRRVALIAASCDIVFAVLPDGCSSATRVKVTHQAMYRDGIFGPAVRLQRALGVGRSEFQFVLKNASESRSFHLEVEGSDSMYVEDAFPRFSYVEPESFSFTDEPTPRVRDRLLAVAPLAGDHRTHFYMRDYDGGVFLSADPATPSDDPGAAIKAEPVFIVEFRERPPGTLGPTLAIATWLAVLTWVVGFLHDQVFPTTGAPSAWPTLIFGVPAVLVGWLLSKVTMASVRAATIGTFLLLAWLAIDAGLLVVLSAAKSSGDVFEAFQWGWLSVDHPWWALMMLTTVAHLSVCLGVFVVRSVRYASTVNGGVRA